MKPKVRCYFNSILQALSSRVLANPYPVFLELPSSADGEWRQNLKADTTAGKSLSPSSAGSLGNHPEWVVCPLSPPSLLFHITPFLVPHYLDY